MSFLDVFVFANSRQEIIHNFDHFGTDHPGVECWHSIDEIVLEMCGNWEVEIGLHSYVVRLMSRGLKRVNGKTIAFQNGIEKATAVDALRFLEWCDKDTEGNHTEYFAQWKGNRVPLLQWFEERAEPFPIAENTWVTEAMYYTKAEGM